MQADMATAEAAQTEAAAESTRVTDALRAMLDDANTDLDGLYAQLDTTTEENAMLKGTLANMDEERGQLMEASTASAARIAELEAQLAEMETAEPVTAAAGLLSPAPAPAQDNGVAAQIAALRAAMEDNSPSTVLALKNDYESQVRDLEAQLEAARAVSAAKAEETSAHLAALSSLRGALEVSEKNVDAGLETEQKLLTDIDALERRKAELEDEIATLTSRNGALSAEAEELGGASQQMRVELAGITKERDALQTEIERLNGSLEAAKVAADDARMAAEEESQRVSLLSSSSSDMEGEVETLRAELGEARETVTSLEAQLSEAVAASDAATGELETVRADYAALQATAEEDAQAAADSLSAAEQEAAAKAEELAAVQERIAGYEEQIAAADADAERLRGIVQDMVGSYSELTDERDMLAASLDDAQTERTSLLSQKAELGEDVEALTALEERNAALSAEITGYEERITAMNDGRSDRSDGRTRRDSGRTGRDQESHDGRRRIRKR